MATQTNAAFSKDTIDFFKALEKNNSREWFSANKERYEESVKLPAVAFCAEMTECLQRLTGLAHEPKIYRIHRDVRFSKDKKPYNAHLHISFLPETAVSPPPAWFFGVDPHRASIGAGYISFEKKRLETFRREVEGAEGKKLAAQLSRMQRDGITVSDPELKRVPPPYPSDHPHADLLRHKSLSVWIHIDDPYSVAGSGFAKSCEANFKQLRPLVSWLLEH